MTPPPPIPPDLRALMAEIGPRWGSAAGAHVKLMLERFTALQRTAPKDGVAVTRDIAYGAHPRQCFDVFAPAAPGRGRAAVLFVHGGAFVEGERNRSDEIYANVLYYFARAGVVGVNVEYRLAQDAPYPGASEDVGAAVAAVAARAEELGIDPARLFLMGHSAGAAHVASYAYERRLHPPGGPGVAGIIIVSGRVRADVLDQNPNADKVARYYGTRDPARLDALSPVMQVDAASVPTLVAWGEYENPLLDVYCAELVWRLAAAKRRGPPVVWLAGHNHSSTVAHINTAEDRLGRAMLDFIARPR